METERWIFLRSNGAVKPNTGSVGRVLRDHKRELNHLKLRKCSVFKVELWGIFYGAFLLQGRYFDRLLIQKNNIKIMRVIKKFILKCSNSIIIDVLFNF